MKTAISLPDSTYIRVNRLIKRLGISRSRFFLDAAESYLMKCEADDLTARMNVFVDFHGDQKLDPALKRQAGKMLLRNDW